MGPDFNILLPYKLLQVCDKQTKQEGKALQQQEDDPTLFKSLYGVRFPFS